MRYLCKLKDNPHKVYAGTVAGVTFCRHLLDVERDDKGKPTGQRWYREPVFDLTPELVAAVQARLPQAVLRAGAGLVKLDGVRDKDGARLAGKPVEGDLPLADFLDFRPWDGPSPADVDALRKENEALKARLAALERQAQDDDAEEAAQASDAVLAERPVGPRNRHKPAPTT